MTEKQTLTLPASLERLEIDPGSRCSDGIPVHPEKSTNPFQEVKGGWEMDCINPEAVLESLSLSGAECPSGTCHCNKRRLQGATNVLHRTSFKRPILQRSRLNSSQLPRHKVLIKEPVLRLAKGSAGTDPSQPVDSTSSPIDSTTSPKTSAQTAEDLALHVGAAILEQKKKKLSCLVLKGKQRRTKMEVRFSCPGDLPEAVKEYPGTDVPNRSVSKQQIPTSSTSPCSLQARLTDGCMESPAASPHSQPSHNPTDDTTIDELASYFDLFVHIPKKMSHMAEMMYI